MSAHEIIQMFLGLGLLLFFGVGLGELAKRRGQPAVLGEILAGILLGPTVLGHLAPHALDFLFPTEGHAAVVLDGLRTLAVTLFLLVAGMEVDLSRVLRRSRAAAAVSAGGILLPFAMGLATAFLVPDRLGHGEGTDPWVFALFFATALSISALPVIARTLMDLNLYRTDVGLTVIASAVVNDLAGWIVFAVVLGLMAEPDTLRLPLTATIVLTPLFFLLMFTVGRSLIDRALPYVQAHTDWPGGVLSFALALTLLGAAFTEWIGIHAVFGAFVVGVAVGDSRHLMERTRTILHSFVSSFFAPIFFAGIGLRVDFAQHFDPLLVLAVLLIASAGKLLGCTAAARLAGMSCREAAAVGFAMNSRGAMEIILGLLALQVGLIREPLFVALVVMALATSLASGPAMMRLLKGRVPRRFRTYLSAQTFIRPLAAAERFEAIRELSRVSARAAGLDPADVEAAVIERENAMSTGLGRGLAVPHARLANIDRPVVVVGLSADGIDFDAPDGEPARLLFLILTPDHDDGAQTEILADVARTFADESLREKALHATTYTEFLSALKVHGGER